MSYSTHRILTLVSFDTGVLSCLSYYLIFKLKHILQRQRDRETESKIGHDFLEDNSCMWWESESVCVSVCVLSLYTSLKEYNIMYFGSTNIMPSPPSSLSLSLSLYIYIYIYIYIYLCKSVCSRQFWFLLCAFSRILIQDNNILYVWMYAYPTIFDIYPSTLGSSSIDL